MDALITIVAFLLILGGLVFVHELGHFMVARRNGIKVEEFAFGLPLLPAIFKRKRGETEYSIYPVPLGGFVRMLGEDGDSKDKRSFSKKSPGVRAKVLVAGVTMNFLLALLLLTVGFAFKMNPIALCASDYPNATYQNDVKVAAVGSNSVAEKAGIKADDTIRRIGDQPIDCSHQVSPALQGSAGKPIAVSLERDGQTKNVTVTPGEPGTVQQGKIGIGPADDYVHLDYPAWESPYIAGIESVAIVGATLTAIGDVFTQLFTRATVPEGIAGPVGIAKLTGDVIDLGPLILLRFVAIISLSLAVFNLLPIPALDGGRLVFVGLEKLRGGKPVTPKLENAVHLAGFAFLILFILVITYFDVTR